MTKSTFTTTAQPIAVAIAGQSLIATPKTFSTGSVGFYVNGSRAERDRLPQAARRDRTAVRVNVPFRIGDQTVMLQISGSFAAIGSKEWQP